MPYTGMRTPWATRAVLIVATAAAALPLRPLQAQHQGNATLNRAVDVYSRVSTARGTFEQSLTNPLTGTTVTARGEFLQQRPSHLAIRFTDPDGDRIVADGKWIWVYVPSATPGQVMRMPVGAESSGGGPVGGDFIAQFQDPFGRRGDVEMHHVGVRCSRIDPETRDARQGLRER